MIYKTLHSTLSHGATRTSVKGRGELWYSGKLSSSFSTSHTRRATLISHQCIYPLPIQTKYYQTWMSCLSLGAQYFGHRTRTMIEDLD